MINRVRQISPGFLPTSASYHMLATWHRWYLVAWRRKRIFPELLDTKVLLEVLKIPWYWHLKFCSVFSKPATAIKWNVNRRLLHALCITSSLTCIPCAWRIIVCISCGRFPALAAMVLLLSQDCLIQWWTRLSLKDAAVAHLRFPAPRYKVSCGAPAQLFVAA